MFPFPLWNQWQCPYASRHRSLPHASAARTIALTPPSTGAGITAASQTVATPRAKIAPAPRLLNMLVPRLQPRHWQHGQSYLVHLTSEPCVNDTLHSNWRQDRRASSKSHGGCVCRSLRQISAERPFGLAGPNGPLPAHGRRRRPAVLHLGGTRTAEPPHPQTATPTFSRRIITTKQKFFVVRDQAFGDDRGACRASPSDGFSC